MVLPQQRRRSYGIAGSGVNRSKRLDERLVSRHHLFITRWSRTAEFGLRHGVARGWHCPLADRVTREDELTRRLEHLHQRCRHLAVVEPGVELLFLQNDRHAVVY